MSEWTSLHARALWLFYLQAVSRLLFVWVPACVAMAVALSATISVVAGLGGAAALFFALFLLAVWYPTLAFHRWGYAVTEDEVLISRGVVIRQVTAIPLGRVQHVDTRQGVLEQWLGLARLQIFTASGIGADGVIPGLGLDVAETLRDRLVKATGMSDGV